MVSNIFLFLPLPRKMIQFDEHIFQLGWTHQLDQHFLLPLGSLPRWLRGSNRKAAPVDLTGLRDRQPLATLEARELRDLGGSNLGFFILQKDGRILADIHGFFWIMRYMYTYITYIYIYICASIFFSHSCPVFCVFDCFFFFFLIPVFVWFSFFGSNVFSQNSSC